jgi:hypothetical protein
MVHGQEDHLHAEIVMMLLVGTNLARLEGGVRENGLVLSGRLINQL